MSSRAHARIYLVRHAETDWAAAGNHTGRTDVPLNGAGEHNAGLLGVRLRGMNFAQVLTSPLRRARRTCEIAGFGGVAVADPDLMELDYGEYEGRRSAEIQQERPGWNVFRDGCPHGETPAQVADRADRVIAHLREATGDVLLFSHGHFLRVLTARWLMLPAIEARRFLLRPSTLSILGYEHNNPEEPVVTLWNDDRHLAARAGNAA